MKSKDEEVASEASHRSAAAEQPALPFAPSPPRRRGWPVWLYRGHSYRMVPDGWWCEWCGDHRWSAWGLLKEAPNCDRSTS